MCRFDVEIGLCKRSQSDVDYTIKYQNKQCFMSAQAGVAGNQLVDAANTASSKPHFSLDSSMIDESDLRGA